MTIFFENNTAAGDSPVVPIVISRGELLALNLEGLGDATAQLKRLAPSGNYIPVSYGDDNTFALDGHYIIDGLSGNYRLTQTGTATGLYASLETESAARASAE